MLFCLFFSLNYCFAAVVLIATNKVEYTLLHRVTGVECLESVVIHSRKEFKEETETDLTVLCVLNDLPNRLL